MKSIQIKAPAKINIGLNLVRKRDDGFHDLETFFYPVNDLYDELHFEKSNKFRFNCSNEELAENNLVIKVKELMEREANKELNVNVNLIKNIPAGAGLGGGSSDAAATLISLNELFSLQIDYKKLIELALQLGSDVPFFLKAKPSIGRSRGEDLTICNIEIPYHLLIVNPKIHISTKEAFENVKPRSANINYNDVFSSMDSFLKNKDKIKNDFEEFAFHKHPEIKKIKEDMLEGGALFAMMSGSGSTVYGFFNYYSNASSVEKKLPINYLRKISSPD